MESLKTTKSGVSVELVDFINGGQGRKLGLIAGSAATVEEQEAMQDLMIEICVKGINGSNDDIVEKVKELPLADYMEVIEFCTELFSGLTEQKKTI